MKNLCLFLLLTLIPLLAYSQVGENKIPILNLDSLNYPIYRDTNTYTKSYPKPILESVPSLDSCAKLMYKVKLTNDIIYTPEYPIVLRGVIYTKYNNKAAYDLENGNILPFGSKEIKQKLNNETYTYFLDKSSPDYKLINTINNRKYDIKDPSDKLIYTDSIYVDQNMDTIQSILLNQEKIGWKIKKEYSFIRDFNNKYIVTYHYKSEDKFIEIIDIKNGKSLLKIKGKKLTLDFFKLKDSNLYYLIQEGPVVTIYSIDLLKQQVTWCITNINASSFFEFLDNQIYLSNLRIINPQTGKFLFKEDNILAVNSITKNFELLTSYPGEDDPAFYLFSKKKKKIIASTWLSIFGVCTHFDSYFGLTFSNVSEKDTLVAIETCDDGTYLLGFKLTLTDN